ncbi:MAG: DNA repair exonuclease [Acidobacteria bacterium]|nr:DNA repair exonuclease [Acidobacteriota bacterium]
MARSTFLHAADLHLGAPLQSLGNRLGPEAREEALRLSRRAFDTLVRVAIEEEVAFVVLAGDVYDRADRDPAARRRVLLGLQSLSDAGIPVFIAHGNHDPLTSAELSGDLPPGITVFPTDRVAQHDVMMPNGVTVTVAGISYERAEESRRLVEAFAGVSGSTVVGVLHTNVGGASAHGNYAPSSVAELEASPVQYWALGHIHDRQVHATPKGWWAYPGNLQGRSTKATECGAKGVLLVDVNAAGSFAEPRFVPCDALRFERVTVDLAPVTDVPEVSDHVLTAIATTMEAADDRPLFVRLELTGPTPVAAALDQSWNDYSEGLIEEVTAALGRGALVKILRTYRPAIDLIAERRRERLLGKVLLRLDADPELAEDPALRAEIERTLVAALDGSR